MMFDPYHKWLGILPKDQPPNHYRLLSLEALESDLDVIEGAADRQMGFIRQYQSGEHAALAAKLLNEIATARLCLLKPKSKAEYDAKLRFTLKVQEVDRADGISFSFDPELAAMLRAPKQPPEPKPTKTSRASKPSQVPLIAGGIGAGVLILLVAFFLSRGGQPAQKVVPVKPEIVETKPSRITDRPAAESETAAPSQTMLPVNPQSPENTPLEPKVEPLAEAVGPVVDLIPAVDLVRDTFAGPWKKDRASLIGGPHGRIYLPAPVPDDYQLKFRIKRIEGQDTLIIGFLMDGQQGMVAFDAYGGLNCGLYLDRRQPNVNSTTRPGMLFHNNRSSTVVLNVHPGHFTATVDDQKVIEWYGESRSMFCQPDHGVPNRESPFLVAANATYQIESAELLPIKPEVRPERAKRLDSWVDVMPLLDPKRDGNGGDWGLNQNALSTPRLGVAKYSLPVSVPEEYTLSAVVDFPLESQPDSSFVVGLVAGDAYGSVVVINRECVGLEMIDGLRWNANEARLGGQFVSHGKSASISCTVTKRGIRMDCDGRTLINWSGDFRRLSPQPDWAPTDVRKLLLASSGYFKVSKIKLGPPLDPPGLPEPSPLQKTQPLDLLSWIVPTRDALSGTWTKVGTALRVMGDIPDCKLVIPFEPPPEYKLTMRVARELGGGFANECLVFNLPIDSCMAEVFLDGWGSTISGIDLDRLTADNPFNVSSRRLQAIPSGEAQEFVMFVRKTGVKVTSGSKTIIDWTGTPNRLWMQTDRCTPAGRIGLVSNHGRFRFDNLEIEPLEPSSFPMPAKLGSGGNLLPIIDVTRDSRRGQWDRSVEGIVSPAGFPGTRLNVPVAPPDRYVLTADVERRKGSYQFCVGLVVGGYPCNVVIDGGAGGDSAGLERLDDRGFGDEGNMTRRVCPGPQLQPGKRVKIQCVVMPDTVLVACGDKEVIRWHGDPRRFSLEHYYLPPNWSQTERTQLWFGTWETEFLIRDLTLRTLGDEDVENIVNSFSGVFPTTYQATVPLSASTKLMELESGNSETATVAKQSKSGEVLQKGKWNALIDLVQLPEHVLAGKWGKRDGSLVCDPSNVGRVMIPVAVRGSYELNLEFTRRTSDEFIAMVFPVGTTACSISLSLDHGAVSGLGFIDGKPLVDTPKAAIRPGSLENGKRIQLHVEVVQNGERVAIKTSLDDKPFLSWQGPVSQLSCPPVYAFPSLQTIGVVVNQSQTEIHKLELRIKGDGKAIVLGNDWRNVLSQAAAGPTKDILADCLTFNGRKYFVSAAGMTFPMAQRLAAQLRGRLLTISSAEEESFVNLRVSGRFVWTSSWRREGTNDWRDDRNRPLQFIPSWAPGQPTNHPPELWTFIHTQIKEGVRGFHDCLSWDEA